MFSKRNRYTKNGAEACFKCAFFVSIGITVTLIRAFMAVGTKVMLTLHNIAALRTSVRMLDKGFSALVKIVKNSLTASGVMRAWDALMPPRRVISWTLFLCNR